MRPRHQRVETAVRVGITTVVGLIGAAAGFHHTHEAAVRAGQTGWLAWADAVVIECMVIVAGLQIARERKAGKSGRLPMTVLVVAFLIQMGAQVSGAPTTFAGWLFAAVPALGCLVVVKFAWRGADTTRQDSDSEAEATPTVVTAEVADERPALDPVAVPEPREPQREEPVTQAPMAAWPPR